MMIKKIIVGVLAGTILVAGGAAVAYQGFNTEKAEAVIS